MNFFFLCHDFWSHIFKLLSHNDKYLINLYQSIIFFLCGRDGLPQNLCNHTRITIQSDQRILTIALFLMDRLFMVFIKAFKRTKRRIKRLDWVASEHKPAHKIADDISMTDDNLEAVLLLLGVGSVDVPAERCLDPCAILVVLLKPAQEFHNLPREDRKDSTAHPRQNQPQHSSSNNNISDIRL